MGRATFEIFAPRAVYGGGANEYFLQSRCVSGRLLRDGNSSTGAHATHTSSNTLQRMGVVRVTNSHAPTMNICSYIDIHQCT